MRPYRTAVEQAVTPLSPVPGSRVAALPASAHETWGNARRPGIPALATASADLPPRPSESLVGRVFADVGVEPEHACHVLPGHAVDGIRLLAPAAPHRARLSCPVARRVPGTSADLAGLPVPGIDRVAEALGMRLQRAAA
jgi:hypothetical protein